MLCEYLSLNVFRRMKNSKLVTLIIIIRHQTTANSRVNSDVHSCDYTAVSQQGTRQETPTKQAGSQLKMRRKGIFTPQARKASA